MNRFVAAAAAVLCAVAVPAAAQRTPAPSASGRAVTDRGPAPATPPADEYGAEPQRVPVRLTAPTWRTVSFGLPPVTNHNRQWLNINCRLNGYSAIAWYGDKRSGWIVVPDHDYCTAWVDGLRVSINNGPRWVVAEFNVDTDVALRFSEP